MPTFVSIGNGTKSFARLLDRVAAIAPTMPQPVYVQYGNTPYASPDTQNFAFVDQDRFDELLEQCDLFITHGGAGSVFSALRLGKKPVVVARLKSFDEVVDDHQLAFLDELARRDLIHPARAMDDFDGAVQSALTDRNLPEPFHGDPVAHARIAEAIDAFAPDNGKLLLVCPSGGHLAEIRALSDCYSARPHFYVINVPIVESPDMAERTQIITLSQRDWKFLVNLWEAVSILLREKPKAILTTGGGFSVAFTLVGKLLGIKTVYIETAAKVVVPTATGKAMYWLADRFFYQWPYLRTYFPRGEYVGLIF